MKLETKVQVEALKLLDKDGLKPAYAEDKEYFYFTNDGFSAFRIYKNLFLLDKNKLQERFTISGFFSPDNLVGTQNLTVTNELRKIHNKDLCVSLKGNNFTTCINEKYLKMFVNEICKLYAKNEKSAVYFVENGEIYAVVMPAIIPKEK